MEKINIEWCKQHDMAFVHVNVARDTSYYFEIDGNVIFVYTTSTTGEQKLYVRNPSNRKEIELTVTNLNKEIDKSNSITTNDLKKICDLIELEYPFSKRLK